MPKVLGDFMIIDDIRIANNVMNGLVHSKFDYIYPFSNENINAAFNNFDLKGKDFLTVLASSDQTFDLYLRGAKSVFTFDINPLTKYYFYLKKAAIKTLCYEEFLQFFSYYDENDMENLTVFNKETFYRKVIYGLDGDAHTFWTYLFNKYPGCIIREAYSLFTYDELKKDLLTQNISYLDIRNYDILKFIIADVDIKFENVNIKYLSNKIESKFDFMYLSNIFQYSSSIFNLNDKILELNEIKKLIIKLSSFLNDSGSIVSYLYAINKNQKNQSKVAIYDKELCDAILNEDFYNININGSYNSKETDNILIYKK